MDATTRQSIALHGGDRSHESGQALWANIPLVYREQATVHTDQYRVYERGDSGKVAPRDHEASPETQSHRALQ